MWKLVQECERGNGTCDRRQSSRARIRPAGGERPKETRQRGRLEPGARQHRVHVPCDERDAAGRVAMQARVDGLDREGAAADNDKVAAGAVLATQVGDVNGQQGWGGWG